MKIHRLLFVVMLFSSMLLTSCELVTEDPPIPILKPANHLVINEVFTLPITHQRVFSWIELYNPTDSSINTTGWTFSFTTNAVLTTFAIVDSSGQVLPTSYRQVLLPDGVYEIPMPGNTIRSGEFFTATNNDERLTTYTDYGPGKGPILKAGYDLTYRVDTARTPLTVTDTVSIYTAIFHLRTTDQLVIKNASGQVVDVVRYGNYVYPGPGADPYPGNRSIGPLPEFQSIARYYGAYSTGNSADDFYVTWPNNTNVPAGGVAFTKPIPHWLSQAYKK